MLAKRPDRLSFLIRLWWEEGTWESGLRVIALDPHTGQRWGFADLEQLMAFLKKQVNEHSSANEER
jgi:hypothetical protein